VLQYLQAAGYAKAAEALAQECGAAPAAEAGMLEKKWTSVVRLQRKVRLMQRVRERARAR
jgi:hypothetical protein